MGCFSCALHTRTVRRPSLPVNPQKQRARSAGVPPPTLGPRRESASEPDKPTRSEVQSGRNVRAPPGSVSLQFPLSLSTFRVVRQGIRGNEWHAQACGKLASSPSKASGGCVGERFPAKSLVFGTFQAQSESGKPFPGSGKGFSRSGKALGGDGKALRPVREGHGRRRKGPSLGRGRPSEEKEKPFVRSREGVVRSGKALEGSSHWLPGAELRRSGRPLLSSRVPSLGYPSFHIAGSPESPAPPPASAVLTARRASGRSGG